MTFGKSEKSNSIKYELGGLDYPRKSLRPLQSLDRKPPPWLENTRNLRHEPFKRIGWDRWESTCELNDESRYENPVVKFGEERSYLKCTETNHVSLRQPAGRLTARMI